MTKYFYRALFGCNLGASFGFPKPFDIRKASGLNRPDKGRTRVSSRAASNGGSQRGPVFDRSFAPVQCHGSGIGSQVRASAFCFGSGFKAAIRASANATA